MSARHYAKEAQRARDAQPCTCGHTRGLHRYLPRVGEACLNCYECRNFMLMVAPPKQEGATT